MVTHRDYVMIEFKHFMEVNKPTGILIDVGCRDNEMKDIMQNEYGFKWIGVDKIGANEVNQGVMEQMPFPDNFADVIFCCHAFEHCEKPIDALREFKRVLKPNGLMFIATPSPCEHQILKGDNDHIFVLAPMQMLRLVKYTDWAKGESLLQTEDIPKEQDYNVITIARK
jgi:SAM-dependent methyltransferase